jgi:hypothetical protein
MKKLCNSLFVGLVPSESLNVCLFYLCMMQDAYYLKPAHHHNQIIA